MRIRRILVAVKDPASKVRAGVAKGAQLARACGAELVLFQAISAPLYLGWTSSLLNEGLAAAERRVRSACLARLERIARGLRRKGLKVTVNAQWDYPVYAAIIREASRIHADLIVAERHAGRHIAAHLLHLTDWELLRLSPVPVLLVKRAGAYRRPVVLAALDPDHSYAKPANMDAQILRVGSAVAHGLHGALHALHAYVPLPVTAFTYGAASEKEVSRLEERSARTASEKLAHAVRALHIPPSRRHLSARHPVDAIEQVAAQTGSAMVVMGAISRSGLKRLIIGNTAEKVLDHLSCDVLVVKPPGLIRQLPRTPRGADYVSLQPASGLY